MATLNIALTNPDLFLSPGWGSTSTVNGRTAYSPTSNSVVEFQFTATESVSAEFWTNATGSLSYNLYNGSTWSGWTVVTGYTLSTWGLYTIVSGLTDATTYRIQIQRSSGAGVYFDYGGGAYPTFQLSGSGTPTIAQPPDFGPVYDLTATQAHILIGGAGFITTNGNTFWDVGHPDFQIRWQVAASATVSAIQVFCKCSGQTLALDDSVNGSNYVIVTLPNTGLWAWTTIASGLDTTQAHVYILHSLATTTGWFVSGLSTAVDTTWTPPTLPSIGIVGDIFSMPNQVSGTWVNSWGWQATQANSSGAGMICCNYGHGSNYNALSVAFPSDLAAAINPSTGKGLQLLIIMLGYGDQEQESGSETPDQMTGYINTLLTEIRAINSSLQVWLCLLPATNGTSQATLAPWNAAIQAAESPSGSQLRFLPYPPTWNVSTDMAAGGSPIPNSTGSALFASTQQTTALTVGTIYSSLGTQQIGTPGSAKVVTSLWGDLYGSAFIVTLSVTGSATLKGASSVDLNFSGTATEALGVPFTDSTVETVTLSATNGTGGYNPAPVSVNFVSNQVLATSGVFGQAVLAPAAFQAGSSSVLIEEQQSKGEGFQWPKSSQLTNPTSSRSR